MRKKDLKQKSLIPNGYWLKTRQGFTLIEVLIYMSIITMVLGSSIVIVFNIIEGNNNLSAIAAREENAGFILNKIEWALLGASQIISPEQGSSGNILSTNKPEFAFNPITFSLSGSDITMQTGGGDQLALNSELTAVGGITFEHIAPVGDKPAGLTTSITISGVEYSTMIYLR